MGSCFGIAGTLDVCGAGDRLGVRGRLRVSEFAIVVAEDAEVVVVVWTIIAVEEVQGLLLERACRFGFSRNE